MDGAHRDQVGELSHRVLADPLFQLAGKEDLVSFVFELFTDSGGVVGLTTTYCLSWLLISAQLLIAGDSSVLRTNLALKGLSHEIFRALF